MVASFPVTETDLSSRVEIYDYYILNTTATFHNEKITIPELREFLHISQPKYAFFALGKITGSSDIAS
jgi:L-amino acid N-acyltransferase YncA